MYFERLMGLWLFVLLVPLFVTAVWAISFLKKFDTLSDFLVYSRLPTWRRRYCVYGMYFLGIACSIFALTNPYIYVTVKDRKYSNIRIIFVVDVSRSMVYAEDVPPNRLEATKSQIRDFYHSLDGVYECSILPFAGDVNPYFCPFTTTKSSFLSMLGELDWRSAPTLGTDLTKAIDAINDIYVKKDKIDKSGLNIVILLSDGGKEEALATDRIKLLKMTRELGSKNFRIYTVGVGSDKATPLIVRDSKGGFVRYLTGTNNQISTSRLDEEILKQIAKNGGGRYYNLNSSMTLAYDLQKVIKENRRLVSEQTKLEKFDLQPYLFSVTVCLLMVCLLLNKV